MQTLQTTSLAMIHSPRKLKIFDIDHAWHTGAIQGTSRNKLYQGLNHLVIVDGIKNLLSLIKLSITSHKHILLLIEQQYSTFPI